MSKHLGGVVEIGIGTPVAEGVISAADAVCTRAKQHLGKLGRNARHKGGVLTVYDAEIDLVRLSEFPEISLEMLNSRGTCHISDN